MLVHVRNTFSKRDCQLQPDPLLKVGLLRYARYNLADRHKGPAPGTPPKPWASCPNRLKQSSQRRDIQRCGYVGRGLCRSPPLSALAHHILPRPFLDRVPLGPHTGLSFANPVLLSLTTAYTTLLVVCPRIWILPSLINLGAMVGRIEQEMGQ